MRCKNGMCEIASNDLLKIFYNSRRIICVDFWIILSKKGLSNKEGEKEHKKGHWQLYWKVNLYKLKMNAFF